MQLARLLRRAAERRMVQPRFQSLLLLQPGASCPSCCLDPCRQMSSARMTKTQALATLGLESSASTIDVKHRFFALAKITHPDVSDSPDATAAFIKLGAALETLVPKGYGQNALEVPDEADENELSRERKRALGAMLATNCSRCISFL